MSPASAIQVITAGNDHSFILDESALKRILLDRKVKDRKVIVLSIAGAYRTGKSFLLNFFLRHLYSKGSQNWNDDPDAPLNGFNWKAGAERNTTGILMWGEPFEVNLPNGEKTLMIKDRKIIVLSIVGAYRTGKSFLLNSFLRHLYSKACVLLMDTQGAFDNQSTVKDCGTVFALSTMLSSVQIYNIMSNIRENDLQHLQYFTEYGRLAMEKSKSKPFQDLLFLVRDWQCPYEYEYGLKGGEKLIRKRLEISGEQHQELLRLRRHLHSCFAKIKCCLIPHPGKKAATCQDFDGRLSDIDDDFKVHVDEFVSSLLSPENLVVKEINGTAITGGALFEHFKAYVKTFQGSELPELKSIFEATAEANNLTAVAKAKDYYADRMELVCGVNKGYVWVSTLQQKHIRYKQEAVQLFLTIRKMGSEEQSRGFQEQLEKQLDDLYENYKLHNSAKKPCQNWCCKQLLCCS